MRRLRHLNCYEREIANKRDSGEPLRIFKIFLINNYFVPLQLHF